MKIMTQKQYLRDLDRATSCGIRIGFALGKLQAVNEIWAEFHPTIPRPFIEAFNNDSLDNFETGCR